MRKGRTWRRFSLMVLLLIAFTFSPLHVWTVVVAASGTTVDPRSSETSTGSPETSGTTVTAIEPAVTTTPSDTTASSIVVYPEALVLSHSAASAIVIDTSRGRVLYEKDSTLRLNLPAANKILTALIAIEKLPLDTKVTISKVASQTGYGENTDDQVILRTGDKYTLEYLLLRMLYFDSDAAAVAIAEQISNEESEFVKLMNARTDTYKLTDTRFANASGERIELKAATGSGPMPTGSVAPAQYTTAADLAKIVQMALLNDNFSRVFKKQSDYIVLDGKTLVPMVNRISSLWPYSEGRVSGAILSSSTDAACVTTGTVSERFSSFNIISVIAGGEPDKVISDVLTLYDACQRTYENSSLVQAGETYTGAQETTVDGEVFGLIYQKTVQYIHPIGDLYLKQAVNYTSFGPFSRPIQSSMTVGQVVFELVDGTRIAVDVGPDRQILSSISLLDRALSTLQRNRNLYYFLIAALIILLLSLSGHAIALMARLIRNRRSADNSSGHSKRTG